MFELSFQSPHNSLGEVLHGQGAPPTITKTLPLLQKFQGFRGYLSGARDKGQISL